MGDKKNILIVDDDMHIGNMLEETLRLEGYDVSRAYSGTEALMVLNSLRPDLILLDLMLPGLTGEELLPLIKGIPVIIVSAKLDMTNKVKLLLDGAADYVTKPFDMEELLARIVVQLRQAELLKAGASGSGAASGVGEQEAGEEYHSESEITASNITLDWELHTVRIEGGMCNPQDPYDRCGQTYRKKYHPGQDQLRYAGLHRAFAETAYQQHP